MDGFYKGAPNGWPCWSFSNHDVIRHVTRWGSHGISRDALARQTIAMLLSFRGTACLYQGEELGLPEADLAFEELTDPPGIRFWPEYKGRDGCRVPIAWEDGPAPNGFTTGKPWLPVKPELSALNVAHQNADAHSMLNHYRAMLALRREHDELAHGDMRFFRTSEPVLAYRRDYEGKALLCAFNLSTEPVSVRLVKAAGAKLLEPSAADLKGATLNLPANGFAFIALDDGAPEARIAYRHAKPTA